MATTVYEVQELILDDGTTITCKPANIKVMRKGNEMVLNLGQSQDDDEGLRRLLDIVALCTKRERPEFEVDEVDDDGKPTGKKVTNYELMEELFDMDTVFKVIELFLGIKLNDPKLMEAAAQVAMLRAQEENKEQEAEQPGVS